MAIKIKSIPKRNPRNLAAPPQYYASAVHDSRTEIDELSELIAQVSNVSKTDTYAVLTALLEVIPRELSAGSIVNLGELGSFYVSVKSHPSEKAEEISANSVKSSKIIFRPGTILRDTLKRLKFAKK